MPPVRLAEFEDGSIHIEDGHHRCLSYWLSGKLELDSHQYLLVYKEEQDRVRFGKLADLYERVKAMGVRTSADEKVDEARQSIREAARALSQVVVEEVWGHDEYNNEFRTTLREVLNGLLDLKQKLGD